LRQIRVLVHAALPSPGLLCMHVRLPRVRKVHACKLMPVALAWKPCTSGATSAHEVKSPVSLPLLIAYSLALPISAVSAPPPTGFYVRSVFALFG
jgi:hypothetical protein